MTPLEEQEYLALLDAEDKAAARENFLRFYMRMTGFLPPRHVHVIARMLQAMEEDKIDRAMLFAPPRHAKTLLGTTLLPAWIMGRHPDTKIMSVVHTGRYAGKVGRSVRNMTRNGAWPFDDVQLADDSQARDQWATPQGGEYNAFGVIGGNQHGNPAEWLFMDDLVKGRKIAMSAHMRDEVWETYKTDLVSRLQGRRKQLMVFCMAGDTGVLMADGTEKPLRDVRVGDRVATYENGGIGASKILNSANHGPDQVYEIKMLSGRTVKANARHPFLVKIDGVEEWRRTDMLRRGDQIRSVIGVNGAASNAPRMDAENQPAAVDTAQTITRWPAVPKGTKPHVDHGRTIASGKSDTDTALRSKTTTGCLSNKAESARSASEHRTKGQSRIAETGSASTIATTPARSEAYCATSVTSPSVTREMPKLFSPPLPTYVIANDQIVEIIQSGVEDVFDIQVAETENFIANGLVSHNTRWHMDDPAGRILPEDFDGRTGWYKDRENGEPWFVLSLPALAEHEADPETGKGGDALDRKPGEWLWPERFGEKALGGVQKRGGWVWSALYQQRPSPEEGLLFTKDHITRYRKGAVNPTTLTIYGASDYAVTEEAGATDPDYTVHLIFGVDTDFNIYLLDGWRGRTTPDVWAAQFVRLVKKHKPLRWAEEQGQIIKSVGPFLKRMMVQERAFVDRVQISSTTSKEARAQSLLGMAAMGKLFLPERATCDPEFLPVLDALEAELLTFPTGRHDDCVDAMTLFGRLLDRIIGGQNPRNQRSPQGDSLDDLWSRHEAQRKRMNE
jgi:predicted phage terminase large subunit-like protein